MKPKLQASDELTIPPAPQPKTYYLGDYTTGHREFVVLKAGVDPSIMLPKDTKLEDFEAEYLVKQTMLVRIYPVLGWNCLIYVPEDYAAQLDEVRELRAIAYPAERPPAGSLAFKQSVEALKKLRRNPLRRRVLPEDVAVHIGELPNPNYYQAISLLPFENPSDLLTRGVTSSTTFRSTGQVRDFGVVDLYPALYVECVRNTIQHEWIHFMQRKYKGLVATFMDAALEEYPFFNYPYWLTSNDEHHAGFGEYMLNFAADKFREAARKAPMRTTMWVDALEQVLKDAEFHGRCHHFWTKRIAWVRETVLPIAQADAQRLLERAQRLVACQAMNPPLSNVTELRVA